MEQRGNVAAMKDVRTLLRKEECALDMEQRGNYAALKDAQNKSSTEVYADGTGQR
jgi:hypothetical protein